MSADGLSASNRRLEQLTGKKYVLLDGGTATEMVRMGYHNIDDDPLWSARLLKTNPDIVKQVHKNFLNAGSEILDTASYQASVEGFMNHLGVDGDTARNLIGHSVTLARDACRETGCDAVVVGSVGPYGAVLHDGSEYTGVYAEKITKEAMRFQTQFGRQELKAWHRPRIVVLLEAGADMLAVETIPVQKEAEAVVELLSEFPQARCWVSFSCKDCEHTCHGEMLFDAVRSVTQSDQVMAVGLNCTAPEHVCGLLDSLRHLQLNKPILVKPNSGEKWVAGKGWIHGSSSTVFESQAVDWLDHGATWIGGCCRIYPDDIAKAKTALDSLSPVGLGDVVK